MATSHRSRHTALVVENDAASARLLRVVLQDAGCDVRIAADAEQALVALAEHCPDLVIVDLILPMMSGLLLASRIQANPAWASAVLIAVTSFNGSQTERLVRSAGFAAYVRKPIDALTFADLAVSLVEARS